MKTEEKVETSQCPLCGRFTSIDKGYICKEDITIDESEVLLFCGENCAFGFQTAEGREVFYETADAK